MSILIAFLCLLITAVVAAGAAILAYRVGYIKRNSELATQHQKQAEDELKQAQQELFELSHALETERAEWQRRQQKPAYSGGWNPADPLNSDERKYT